MVITEQVWKKHLITNAPLYFTLTDIKPEEVPYVVFTLKDGVITREAISYIVYSGEKTPAQMFTENTLYKYHHPAPVKEQPWVK